MNNERRFDRMEQLLRLIIRAGKRGRTRLQDLDEKIGMLIDAQIKTEDSLREMNKQSVVMRDDLDKRSRDVLNSFGSPMKEIERLTEAQIVSDRKLSALIDRIGSQ